jgi:4-hydroxybenzoate polyprenyltransferase
MSKRARLKTYAGFVKVEHTIFSLPLVFSGMLLYTRGWPGWRLTVLVLLAAAGARIVAMGLNRIIDAEIDALNPRTRQRELPRGAMTVWEAWAIVVVAGAVYLSSAAAIAPVCAMLSPIPVALFVLYPYLKRFTWFSHFGLGLAWSMAPLGGWLAGSRSLSGITEAAPLWAFAVLWVAGFDIIYATMDEAHDRMAKLHSLPAGLGAARALRVAAMLHAMAFLALAILWRMDFYSPVAFKWLIAIGAVFVWQHVIAEKNPEFAFFQLNGALGFLVLGMVLAGMR